MAVLSFSGLKRKKVTSVYVTFNDQELTQSHLRTNSGKRSRSRFKTQKNHGEETLSVDLNI